MTDDSNQEGATQLCESSRQQYLVPVNGGALGAEVIGTGPAVIFLHGGPGDTHHYMKRMALPISAQFQCIFFDQRGTGRSNNFLRNPQNFGLETLFTDLVAIQEFFGAEQVALVGHSWGAMYGLFGCLRYPGRFGKAALLSIGPLDRQIEEQTSSRLLSNFSQEERQVWADLRARRREALATGNLTLVSEMDKRLMELRVKAWVNNPKLRSTFLKEYFTDPTPDREINSLIWTAQSGWFSWEMISKLKTHLWVCSGENDSVPPDQSQRLAALAPKASVTIYQKCGHLPWLEHPKHFYRDLAKFLAE
jgi:pimeloyl-ACP methyl ester carboxylesterase